MGKKKGGHKKRGIVVTPKRIAKGLVVFDGARRAFEPNGLVAEITYVVTHADQIAKEGSGSWKQHGKQLVQTAVVPVLEIVVGPKIIDKGVQVMSKGEPMFGKIANIKLIKVGS